jgi:hypothetical protein
MDCNILKILTDLNSAAVQKDKCKINDSLKRSNQKWNSKIPKPNFLLSCEQNMPKNGYGG